MSQRANTGLFPLKKIQTSMSIEENREWGNSRGQLKKTQNFQGCSRKIHVEFPWVLVFLLGLIPEKIQTGGRRHHGIFKGRVIEERACGNSRQLGKLLKTTYQSGFQWAPSKNIPICPSLYQRKHNGVLFKKFKLLLFSR